MKGLFMFFMVGVMGLLLGACSGSDTPKAPAVKTALETQSAPEGLSASEKIAIEQAQPTVSEENAEQTAENSAEPITESNKDQTAAPAADESQSPSDDGSAEKPE